MPTFGLTPGYEFQAGELVTLAKLNALGRPVITSAPDDGTNSLRNMLYNGTLQLWQRGTASKSCPAAAMTFLADRWFVRPSGAAATVAQTTSPSSLNSPKAALITGASGVTALHFGQRLDSLDTRNPTDGLAFSAWLYNDTGATFAPVLRLRTPPSADNYGAGAGTVGERTMQSCPNAEWTHITWSQSGGFGEMNNGLEVAIQIPSGSLDAGSKSVKITELQLESGTSFSGQERRPIGLETELCMRYCNVFPGVTLGISSTNALIAGGALIAFPIEMRATPTLEGTVGNAGTEDNYFTPASGSRGTPTLHASTSARFFRIDNSEANWTTSIGIAARLVLSAENIS